MSVRSAAWWAIAGQYCCFALQFAVSVVVSRYFLSPAEVGLFSLAFSAAAMISIMQDFGLNRFVVAADTLDTARLRACLTVSMVVGAGIAAAILLMAWPAGLFYRDMRLVPIVAVIGLSFLFLPLNTVPIALLQREMRFRETATIGFAAALANSAVTLLAAASGLSALSLALGVFAQQMTRGLMAQRLCPVPLDYRPLFAGTVPLLRFGSGTTVLAISEAVGGHTPELIIGRAIGVAAVGLYGRAVSLADQLQAVLAGAVSSVFYAVFARLWRGGEATGPTYERVVGCYIGVCWPAMAMLAVVAEPLILTLYGAHWAEVAPLLRRIALSEVVLVALPLHTEVALLAGRLRALLWRNVLHTAVALGLMLIAVRYGLVAAATSRIVYAVVWYGIYAGFIRDITGFRPTALAGVYARSLAATLAAVLPAALLVLRGIGDPFALALAGAAGGLMWLGTLIATAHPLAPEIMRLLPPRLRLA